MAPGIGKFVEIESRIVITWDESRENGELLFNGNRVYVGDVGDDDKLAYKQWC